MTLKPLYDRVVVRRLEPETTTQGGIIIPEKSTEKPTQGEVVAVGDGSVSDTGNHRPLMVQPGDRILFGQYAGSSIKVNDEDLLIMRESEILAILEQQAEQEKAA